MCMGWGAHFVGVCTGVCARGCRILEVPASRTLQVSIWCVYTGLGWGGVQRAGLGWGAHFVCVLLGRARAVFLCTCVCARGCIHGGSGQPHSAGEHLVCVYRAGVGWGVHFVGVCTGACACCVLVHVRVRSWLLHAWGVPASPHSTEIHAICTISEIRTIRTIIYLTFYHTQRHLWPATPPPPLPSLLLLLPLLSTLLLRLPSSLCTASPTTPLNTASPTTPLNASCTIIPCHLQR